VAVAEVRNNGTLVLEHNSEIDRRGLETESARKVLEYVAHVWRRPVILRTVDAMSKTIELTADIATAR
jgi:stage V sporulation protein R